MTGSKDIDGELKEAARLYAAGHFQAATDIYRAILRHAPQTFDALHMLGITAQQSGNTDLALRFFEIALNVRPDSALAWFNRSIALRTNGDGPRALESARMAVETAPELGEAWDICGQILKDQCVYDEAERCYSRALTLQPSNAHFHGNYALLLLAMARDDDAFRALRRAETLDASYPPLPLGNMFKARGYPEQAAARFARTRMLRPGFADAVASEAMARLQMGDYPEGWALWEQRPSFATVFNEIPVWQGDKTSALLLYEDQGLGDALHFARYIPRLRGRVDKIIMHVRAPLRQLCVDSFPGITLIGDNDPPPQADARCRLLSLPFHFQTRLDTIPTAPYLVASAARAAPMRDAVAATSLPRIGLAWAGNAQFHNDHRRSLELSMLVPLLACGPGHFVSLQKDRPQEQAALAKSGFVDAAPLLHDFADTAALIAELDLVITVDTAIAHLAGGLGKPVFILLPFDPDWRWLLGREDSPWYPSARLFRQKKPGDWGEIVTRLCAEVARFIAGDADILRPEVWRGQTLRQNPDALPLPL